MNAIFQFSDFAALSPFLILFAGALAMILLETFAVAFAKKGSFYIAAISFAAAFIAALLAPPSDHALLTPWLVFDQAARYFTSLFLAVGLICSFLAASFFQNFSASRGEFYFLLLSAVFGLNLIGSSADFLTLFLGLETLSIALYVLTGYMKKWELSGEGAIKYFFIGAVGAAFLLYGIALIYGAVGTTQFSGLLEAYRTLPPHASETLFLGGAALLTFGLAFKAAVFPFHFWAPDVYDAAPNPVTAFMAVGAKAGAFAAFARGFLIALPGFDQLFSSTIAYLAIATMIFANVAALRQTQLRRLFAYSGISHAGFLLIPVAVGGPEALASLEFYLAVYAASTLGVFASLSVLDKNSQGVLLSDLQGFFRRSPFFSAVFTLSLLTLAGIPPTPGFFAKFYLFKIAFESGYYALVIVGLLTAILSVFYYLRIVSLMFSPAPFGDETDRRGLFLSWQTAAVGVVIFAAIFIFSIFPEPLFAFFST